MQNLKRLARCNRGATAIEYSLIVGMIALAVIVSMRVLGINLAETFWTLANVIGGAL